MKSEFGTGIIKEEVFGTVEVFMASLFSISVLIELISEILVVKGLAAR